MGAHRQWSPAAKGARVPKSAGWHRSPTYYSYTRFPLIYRERPGPGYRHLLLQGDVECFIALLPGWPELSQGLKSIVLSWGERGCYGWYRDGVIAVSAWESALETTLSPEDFEPSRALLERLSVPFSRERNGYRCGFTFETARAFQLLDAFLHGLGNHHDRMTTRSKRHGCRGEGYADAFARRYQEMIWQRYTRAFGL